MPGSVDEYSFDRHRYVLYCKDFHVAARYAADRSWWLHSWLWHGGENAPDEPMEFRRYEGNNWP